MLGEMLENVRARSPVIHCITNYVTANDCANMLLACGCSPIMADDVCEVEEITARCSGLCINLGTLHQQTVPAMLSAGKKAQQLHHPVVLDPVGAGSSSFRTSTAAMLLSEIRFSAIRGNASEMRALAAGQSARRGVDADLVDEITEENLEQAVLFARSFAQKTGAVIVITGGIDIVTDGSATFCVRNGHPDMRLVTGTGCQLSALTAAFLAANPNTMTVAAAAAVCAMGLCGERAKERLTPAGGNGSLRNAILDEVCALTPERLEARARYTLC